MMRGAIVGAGFFAQFHADAWNRIDGAEIVAVVDSDLAKAREFGTRWSIPLIFQTMGELFGALKVDFVDIVTRPETHRALTTLAARHGAHVICQKPMAPSMEDCEAMAEECKLQGVRLVIHENWRWQPWYREVKRLLDKGFAGQPFQISFRMRTGDGRGAEPYKVQPYFREMPRLLIYETAVHFLDTFRFLLGEVESLSCITERINPVIEGEDFALIQLTFASGATGLIDANRISGPATPDVAFGSLSVEGTEGVISMAPDGSLRTKLHGGEELPHDYPRSMDGYKGDSVFAMQQHFVTCVATGREAESEGKEYLETVALVDACYRSAATKQVEGAFQMQKFL